MDIPAATDGPAWQHLLSGNESSAIGNQPLVTPQNLPIQQALQSLPNDFTANLSISTLNQLQPMLDQIMPLEQLLPTLQDPSQHIPLLMMANMPSGAVSGPPSYQGLPPSQPLLMQMEPALSPHALFEPVPTSKRKVSSEGRQAKRQRTEVENSNDIGGSPMSPICMGGECSSSSSSPGSQTSQTSHTTCKQATDETHSECERLRAENKLLKSNHAAEILKLLEKNTQLQSRLDLNYDIISELRGQIHEGEAYKSELNKKIDEKIRDRNQYEQMIVENEESARELIRHCHAMCSKNAKVHGVVKRKEVELETEKEKNRKLELEIETLEKVRKADLAALTSKEEEIYLLNTAQKGEKDALENQIDQLKTTHEAELVGLRNEMKKLKEEQTKAIDALRKNHDEELQRLRRANEKVEGERDSARAELEAIMNGFRANGKDLLPKLAKTLGKSREALNTVINDVWDGLDIFVDPTVDEIISEKMRNKDDEDERNLLRLLAFLSKKSAGRRSDPSQIDLLSRIEFIYRSVDAPDIVSAKRELDKLTPRHPLMFYLKNETRKIYLYLGDSVAIVDGGLRQNTIALQAAFHHHEVDFHEKTADISAFFYIAVGLPLQTEYVPGNVKGVETALKKANITKTFVR